MQASHLKKTIHSPWALPVFLFLLCVLALAVGLIYRASLDAWTDVVFVSSFISAHLCLMFVLPTQLVFGVLGYFFKCSRRGIGFMMTVPASLWFLFFPGKR
jgi:membrane protein YdbS with pleckstrin-like domain